MIEWICGFLIVLFTAPVILSGIMSCFVDERKNHADNNKGQKNNNRRWDWGS